MKRILTTLKEKWPEYLIEAVVIVASILGAISLENWNEERKSKVQQLEILRNIESGLHEDFNDLSYNLSSHRRILSSQDILISFLDEKISYHDSLGAHFQRINGNTVFIAHEGPFETLKSMGIGLISNDSLRDAIVFVYDRVYDYHDEGERIYNDYFH